MNFGKYSAQNDVWRKQMSPFNIYIVCPIVSLQSYSAVIIVHDNYSLKEPMALYLLYGMSESPAQV